MRNNSNQNNWIFLKNYKNSISNLKLNINLYYKFSNKILNLITGILLKATKSSYQVLQEKFSIKYLLYFNEKKNCNYWSWDSRFNTC